LLVALIIFTIPVINEEGKQFLKDLPGYLSQFEDAINKSIEAYYPEYQFVLSDTIASWVGDIQANVPGILETTFQTIRGVVTFLLGLILIPLMVYYFLMDSPKIKETFKKAFPKAYDERIEASLNLVNVMLGNYVRGRLILAFFVGALVSTGLAIMGVKYPLLLGIFAGLAEFIPIIGPVIAYIPAGLLSLTISPTLFLSVTVFYIIINIAENYLLVPKIMGESMDLHPLTVIIAMMVGAYLAGIIGLLIALPVVAAAKIVFEIFVLRKGEFSVAGTSANPPQNPREPDNGSS